MKEINHLIFKITLLVLLFTSTVTYSQIPGFGDDVDDQTPAPISSLVLVGLIAGAAYGVKKIKK